MRKFDKKRNIKEANIRLEQSYLINKGLLIEGELGDATHNKNKIVINIKSQQELERARTILKKYGEPIDDSSFKFHDTEFFNYLQYLGYPYNSWGLYDNVPSVTSHINRNLISLDELEPLLSMGINESNQRLEEKAIGFKTTGDNRDKDTGSERTKLGFKGSKSDKSDKPEMDWEKMGFKSDEDYKKFLDTKMKDLLDKIKNTPELLAVFKRLHDK